MRESERCSAFFWFHFDFFVRFALRFFFFHEKSEKVPNLILKEFMKTKLWCLERKHIHYSHFVFAIHDFFFLQVVSFSITHSCWCFEWWNYQLIKKSLFMNRVAITEFFSNIFFLCAAKIMYEFTSFFFWFWEKLE